MSADGRRVSILGVTGSVGRSTIEVIEELRGQGADIPVEAVTAGRNLDGAGGRLPACSGRASPRSAERSLLATARDGAGRAGHRGRGRAVGAGGSRRAAGRLGHVGDRRRGRAWRRRWPRCAAGRWWRWPTRNAWSAPGRCLSRPPQASGATLLPVDSEHNAIFQVLTHPERVEKLTLTASGGPFRTASREAMAARDARPGLRAPELEHGPQDIGR